MVRSRHQEPKGGGKNSNNPPVRILHKTVRGRKKKDPTPWNEPRVRGGKGGRHHEKWNLILVKHTVLFTIHILRKGSLYGR